MALKRLKSKKSKRLSGKLKHKIEKKVREHNRKIRKSTKKKPNTKGKSMKRKIIQVPNICPFKTEILKNISQSKEIQEQIVKVNSGEDANRKSCKNLVELVDDASTRDKAFSDLHWDITKNEKTYCSPSNREQSLKQFYKEFKKVIQNADVILEVVDARDPLGTRCIEVEQTIRSAPGNKRLILVLNKVDLIPRENLDSWVRYFRNLGPVTVFKASTQDQSSKLGRRKLSHTNSEKALQGSVCIGAELLMSMLGNYCRNNGIKTSIRVGVVGIPNVGKSSIINSLARGKTCAVGCTPGVTKALQEVELDSKIKLIDSPGVVFSHSAHECTEKMVLKNAQRVSNVKDPFTLAESILKRGSKNYFCNLYDITEYATFEEFFVKKAARMGKFLKKGVPDVVAAARSVLNDWNSGKIKYCTQPPEKISQDVHLSASIVHSDTQEFYADNLHEMETAALNRMKVSNEGVLHIISNEPLEVNMPLDGNEITETVKTIINENQKKSTKRKNGDRLVADNFKMDPVMNLEGNQSLNKNIKDQIKRRRKQNVRSEKKMSQIIGVLDGFTLQGNNNDNTD